MYEEPTRRFTHGMRETEEMEEKDLSEEYGSFTRFPDLIMMDGGRGQVNIALKVLEELHLNIPVCGMVKDDNHRTRGLYYHNVEIPIDRGSEGFKMITRIQDEAHRYAIEYHRSLRSKEQVHSVLDDIPDIGPARRKALMKKYQSLEAIREATEEDLAQTDSMSPQAARAVYRFYREKERENQPSDLLKIPCAYGIFCTKVNHLQRSVRDEWCWCSKSGADSRSVQFYSADGIKRTSDHDP